MYGYLGMYTLVICYSLLLKMAHRKFVELPIDSMVDLSIVNWVVYQRVTISWSVNYNCNILILGLYLWSGWWFQPLKNISRLGLLLPIGKIKTVPNHQPVIIYLWLIWLIWLCTQKRGFWSWTRPSSRRQLCEFHVFLGRYPLVMTNSLLLKVAIEIVDLSITNDDFP